METSPLQYLSSRDTASIFGFLGDKRFWSRSIESLDGVVMSNGFPLNSNGDLDEFHMGIEEAEIPNIRMRTLINVGSRSDCDEDVSLLLDLSSLGFEGSRDIEITTVISFRVKELMSSDYPFDMNDRSAEIVYQIDLRTEICDVIEGNPSEFCTEHEQKIQCKHYFTQELVKSTSSISFKELFLFRFFKESSSMSMKQIKLSWIDSINKHLESQGNLKKSISNRFRNSKISFFSPNNSPTIADLNKEKWIKG